MEPESNPYNVSVGGQPANGQRRTRLVMLSAIVLVVVLVASMALLWVQNLQFRMTGTDPSLDSFSYAVPQMEVSFNHNLSTNGLDVTSSPNIIKSAKVSGKKITIAFRTVTLDKGKTYTITLKSVHDTGNRTITNKVLKFTAKDIPYDKLSTAQQKAVVNAQDNYPYSATSIGINDTDPLLNGGVTTPQIEGLREAFFNFSKSISKQFKQVAIDGDSVSFVPHDPNSSSTVNTVNFNVTIDKTDYTVRLDYSDLTTVELYIYNSGGTQIYDSGTIDKS